jgi:ubiquinone/menaquinone biosynthesis C-methylase UbiE
MKEEEYKLHAKFEKNNWWFIAKRRGVSILLKQYAKNHNGKFLLDIGCGTGMNSEIFQNGHVAIGLDSSFSALIYSKEKKYKYLVAADGASLPFADSSFDTIVALDVLEHLNDDQAIKEMYRICKAGSSVFITVPAFEFLWTSRDERLHHLRRYTVDSLKKKLFKNGFHVRKITYTNLFLLPFLYAKVVKERYFKKLLPIKDESSIIVVPNLVNQILTAWLLLESLLWRWAGLPCGTSLLCFAEIKNK